MNKMYVLTIINDDTSTDVLIAKTKADSIEEANMNFMKNAYLIPHPLFDFYSILEYYLLEDNSLWEKQHKLIEKYVINTKNNAFVVENIPKNKIPKKLYKELSSKYYTESIIGGDLRVQSFNVKKV